MTNDEIIEERNALYRQLEIAKEHLAALRATCKHDDTEEVNYSWRIGVVERRMVCKYCNELMPNK